MTTYRCTGTYFLMTTEMSRLDPDPAGFVIIWPPGSRVGIFVLKSPDTNLDPYTDPHLIRLQ